MTNSMEEMGIQDSHCCGYCKAPWLKSQRGCEKKAAEE